MLQRHRILLTVILGMLLAQFKQAGAQAFIHPGIDQSVRDLDYLRSLVDKKQEPWKSAFDRLKAATDTPFQVKAHTHVLRGAYGRPNVGGEDLSKSANMAYNYALRWYLTREKAYAAKAINILNAWSPVLWDFDYNDAKLLAAWTGSILCNAAEILRYSNAGWQQKDIDQFSHMMLTVYYPLIRYYFPQANGNWDGAIIHSILAIAIFTDQREMFNNAVNHFLHGPVNGSVFKYIFPSGQCQETGRDQGHVQLGLGEFAGAAQVAFTQGTDLFLIGNHRLALGYEYTARILLGESPHSYGQISPRAKAIRDDYEYIYRHYLALGIELPHVKILADSARRLAARSTLTSVRAVNAGSVANQAPPVPGTTAQYAGAKPYSGLKTPQNTIDVKAGESIQKALDSAAGTDGWVLLKAGLHTLPATLKIPSGITLCGEGDSTRLFLNPSSGDRDAMVNASDDLHDLVIRDLVVEGALQPAPGTDPNSSRSFRSGGNRGGIIFRAKMEGQMKHLMFINVTVQNCTYNGVFISGATDVSIQSSDFTENGASVVPGPKLQHNVLLSHCSNVHVTDSRMDTSPNGSGIMLDHCSGVTVNNCEIARNAYYGIMITGSKDITVSSGLVEANDRSGIMVEYLHGPSENISVNTNLIRYNAGFAVETYAARNARVSGNDYEGNGNEKQQEKLSTEKRIIME